MRPALPRDPFPLLAGALATAVVVAPWALGFSASHAAVAGHIAFAMAFGPTMTSGSCGSSDSNLSTRPCRPSAADRIWMSFGSSGWRR